MVFLGREPYKSYDEFVRFCTKTPLKLCYKPLDRWYYLDCEVRTLDKSEISCGLICPIDFIPFGSWYESVIAYRTALDKDFGKRYPYRYNYTYTETARGAAVIDNSGSMESYCRIHVLGPCVNPAWALEQDGKVKVRGRVMASIPEGHELIVDSSPKSMEIAEYTQDGEFIRNLYQASDFATGRFVAVPVGESKMSFSHEGAGMIEAYVEVRALSESV